MSQIEVSDKVKDVLLEIQRQDQHKTMDSVIRALLFTAGWSQHTTSIGEAGT